MTGLGLWLTVVLSAVSMAYYTARLRRANAAGQLDIPAVLTLLTLLDKNRAIVEYAQRVGVLLQAEQIVILAGGL